MDSDPNESSEEGFELYDKYDKNAEIRVLETISQQGVVTDRELKVRLEREFFPWVVGRAVNKLIRNLEVSVVHSPGRKGGMGTPDIFYMDASQDYEDVLKLLLKKRKISSYINSLLTRLSPAGSHAEDVFGRAFDSLRFEIVGRDVSEFGGKSVKGISGKQLPNLDFVIEKNNITYGVDIKNWMKYEFDTIPQVMDKVDLATQLGIVPFICARYADKETIFRIIGIPGIVYRYETLILPPEFRTLADEAKSLLGYPILVANTLPKHKLEFIGSLHGIMLRRLAGK